MYSAAKAQAACTKDLTDHFIRKKIYSQLDFNSRVRDGSSRAMFNNYNTEWYFDKCINLAISNARLLHPLRAVSWKARVMAIEITDIENVRRVSEDFEKLFLEQHIPLSTFTRIFEIMSRDSSTSGKERTIYLQGVANAGKTSLLLLLTSVYEQFEKGKFGPQAIASQFWLQDLYDKEVYVGDEVLVNQVNVQTMLLLMEGNSDLSTELKHKDVRYLEAKPVIIANNVPIWQHCCAFAKAILARCLWIKLMKPTELKLRYDNETLKQVLKYLFIKYQ